MSQADITLDELQTCFSGLIPAIIATASAAGDPNVTYLSRVHPVDGERIALSNQFFAKSSRNLAENPRASLILVRPETHEEFRISIVYERTERRGPTFDRLRNDISMIAALTGMEEVFRLQSADIYRVVEIEAMTHLDETDPLVPELAVGSPDQPAGPAQLGELCARLSRCGDLDTLVRVTVDGLAELFGYEHSQLMLLDEGGTELFTIASRGYDEGGIGAEVAVGTGIVGVAAAEVRPIVLGNLAQMTKYSRSVRRSFEGSGAIGPGHEVPMVGLAQPGSQIAIPALSVGQLVGVLLIESEQRERFAPPDTAALTVVASIVAASIESLRAEVRTAGAVSVAPAQRVTDAGPSLHVRHFPEDGSTFLDGDYLIKGVAGKLLWSLLRQHTTEGRTDFTNREVRLDASLDLPDFRDNFESRLILLKRRLDEREAAVRIHKTGRGRFRLDVAASLRLESMGG